MKNKTKRTLKNIIHYLELKTVHYRKMEDWSKSKGNIEGAEKWKHKRWLIEDIIEELRDEEKFNAELKYLSIGEDAE